MEENEGAPSAAPNCFTPITASTGLAWSTVTDCGANEANDVQNEAASATPSHSYVPWPIVDGVLLEDTGVVGLKTAICKAYTGPNRPSACNHLVTKQADKCMNK